MRCVGTSNAHTGAAKMTDPVVVVTTDNCAEIRFHNARGEMKRKLALDEEDDIIGLAHQLIAAQQMIKSRREVKEHVRQQRRQG